MTDTENTLQTFDFVGLELRVIMHMAEPWFVATDVCRALGLTVAGGSTRHPRDLNQDEVSSPQVGPVASPNATINESGLFKLIMRSDKPEARKYQDCVTREVLTAIRKTGGYLLNAEARETAHADDRQAIPLPSPLLWLGSLAIDPS